MWFTTHVTCPICRYNLADDNEDPQLEAADVVTILVELEEAVNGEDQPPGSDWESEKGGKIRIDEVDSNELVINGRLGCHSI